MISQKVKDLCNLSGGDLCWRVVRMINFAFVLIGLVLFVYWGFIDRSSPVMVFDSGSVDPEVASPGDVVQVSWVLTKVKMCPGTGYRVLSGECGAHILRVGEPSAPLFLVPTIFNINFVVPADVQPGVCTFHLTVIYRCNPFQEFFPIMVDFPPINFSVKLK